MKIKHIAITTARQFNHPCEQYANFRFDCGVTAEIDDQDDVNQCIAQLRRNLETEADEHKAAILADLRQRREIAEQQQHIEQLRRQVARQQSEQAELEAAEARLNELCSKPLVLHAPKTIHPGHPDHPETDNWHYGNDDDD